MRRFLFLALGALVCLTVWTERRAPNACAAFAQQGKAQAAEESSATPVVRELDQPGLKKLLERGAGKEARPLLVNFWATWCEPCREEFPDLVRIEADYGKRGLDVIFISLDDPSDIKAAVPDFLREVHAEKLNTYLLNTTDPIIAIKETDPTWQGAVGLPVTFLFDAQGKIVFKHSGRVKPAELRAALDTLIKK
ncbi:MAG: TlpA family protein disulfide reductase [Acidobacteria bacterium]|nr:TlpA family protein disulfide reductase [Acidobacteriota bacterium]